MAATEDIVGQANKERSDMGCYPLISVRMPAYNHERFIEDALDSIVQETYPNLEIVITDDCSTDSTAEVVQQWINRNPKAKVDFCMNHTNQGIAKTINQTIARCRGEYIINLASDDLLLKDGIIKRYHYLRDNPTKRAVFADCIVIDQSNQTIYQSGLAHFSKANTKNFKSPEGVRKELILNWGVPGPVLMLHRSIIDIIGPYDECVAAEDFDYYLRMASCNLIGFINEKVSAYRIHGKNTCLDPDKTIIILKSMIDILVKNMSNFNILDRWRALRKIKKIEKGVRRETLKRKLLDQ